MTDTEFEVLEEVYKSTQDRVVKQYDPYSSDYINKRRTLQSLWEQGCLKGHMNHRFVVTDLGSRVYEQEKSLRESRGW
jgi:hypothetical protein